MPDSPWDPFINMQDRVKEALEPLGLKLIQFQFIPGEDRIDTHHGALMFEVNTEAFKPEEDRRMDAEFEEIARRERLDATKQRAAQAREKLLNLDSDGLFADDDDTDVPDE